MKLPSAAALPLPSLGCALALMLTGLEAQAGTIEIRPLFSYTVSQWTGSSFLAMEDELYSNGQTEPSNAAATKVRMEFRIPPEVLAGLKTMEFLVNQEGVSAEDSGYSYLWYYPGLDAQTKADVDEGRSGFTAKSLTTATVISRNLLEGFDNTTTTVARREKLGLALDVHNFGTTDVLIHFSDPRLVINYHSRSANNGEEVAKLLTAAEGPFPGATDPALVGFEADPDQDGIPNFMEIWRGTRPDRADAVAAPGVPTAAPPPTYGTSAGSSPGEMLPWTNIRVSRENDDFLLVGAEASHDLIHWRDISASRKIQAVGPNHRYVTFTDSVPVEGRPMRYFRFISAPAETKFPLPAPGQ